MNINGCIHQLLNWSGYYPNSRLSSGKNMFSGLGSKSNIWSLKRIEFRYQIICSKFATLIALVIRSTAYILFVLAKTQIHLKIQWTHKDYLNKKPEKQKQLKHKIKTKTNTKIRKPSWIHYARSSILTFDQGYH